MDVNFVNDSTIYYNFPPLSSKSGAAEGVSRRRSTLPRPHSSCIFEGSSCPSSPQLSEGIKIHNRGSNGFVVGCHRGCETPNVGEAGREICNRGDERPSQTTSVGGTGVDVVYQNIDSGSKGRRRRMGLFPWWRRKHKVPPASMTTSAETAATRYTKEKGEESVLEEAEEGDEEPSASPSVNEDLGQRVAAPSNYLTLPTRSNSTCSSSTTFNEDDDDRRHTERTSGGVSYAKPTRTIAFHTPALPRDDLSANGEISAKISNWVREWRRKSRWLTRRRRQKNPRHRGDGDVDIALVHFGKDTGVWADYLHESFTNLLQDKLGRSQVRVEKLNVDSFAGYQELPEVQASRLNNAKLQIVILSPGFLSFLNAEPELRIGKLLRPNRVLALLLGITPQTVKNDPLAMSSLYSFEEWSRLQVRDRDSAFVAHLQEESLRKLNQCDLFDQCKMSSAFSLCPRKVTQNYCKVYIHLKSPFNDIHERQVHVTVGQTTSNSSPISYVQCHNPYTLSFDVPEKFLGVSTFLKVNLFVDGSLVGSREVKCEGSLEILTDLLRSAVDPTGLMCQALGISPASNDLDDLLAQKVKGNLPSSRDFNCLQFNNGYISPASHELPTWLHFSAYYGLQSFTWALLDVPSGERALLVKNCKGYTPAKLALQSGYTKLAQDLENVVIVASLSLNGNSSQTNPARPNHDANYSPVPEPRPCTPKNGLLNYDTPPYPRVVKGTRPKTTSSVSEEFLTSTPKDNVTVYANLLLDSLKGSSDKSEVLDSNASESVTELAKDQEYLDMSGMSIQFEEYQKEVSILVNAWGKRNDAKTFLSEYEHTISKLKSNFHFKINNNEEGENVSTLSDLRRELNGESTDDSEEE